MRRRAFVTLAGASAIAAALPRAAMGQPTQRMPRIAVVGLPLLPNRVEALRQGLADHGYIDGTTVTVDYFPAPTSSNLPGYAALALASKPDVILCTTTPATVAAKALTNTIPIVMVTLNDPVGNGLGASIARPGGNVTGNTTTNADVAGKQLALFRELAWIAAPCHHDQSRRSVQRADLSSIAAGRAGVEHRTGNLRV
jgi:putative ABC transport system substrate-binding protein